MIDFNSASVRQAFLDFIGPQKASLFISTEPPVLEYTDEAFRSLFTQELEQFEAMMQEQAVNNAVADEVAEDTAGSPVKRDKKIIVKKVELDTLKHYGRISLDHNLGLTKEEVESGKYGLIIYSSEQSGLGGLRQETDGGNLYWGCFMRWHTALASSPYYIHWSENKVSFRYRNRLNRSVKDVTIYIVKYS